MTKQKQMTPVILTQREVEILYKYAPSTFSNIFGEYEGLNDCGDHAYRLSYSQVADVYSALAFLEEEGYSV